MRHEFIEFMPDRLENGVLYISMSYNTATHLCACGCGKEVVTPISPIGWSLTYNGQTISLRPSIGNWNFPCKSHYFITDSKVQWARTYTEVEMDTVRKADLATAISYGKQGVSFKHNTLGQKENKPENTNMISSVFTKMVRFCINTFKIIAGKNSPLN